MRSGSVRSKRPDSDRPGSRFRRAVGYVVVVVVAFACGDDGASSSSDESSWVEEEVTFSFGADELYGVLTLPPGEGPHPAIVLVSGSGGPDGDRAGATSRTFVDHSHRLALDGFAALRYDPPGVGRSTGDVGLPSLEARVEETVAALSLLRSSPMVDADRVGLLGFSQGPWVMAMTAVRHPDDVAFLISVVGSGQSVARQQVHGIEAQSRAAGLAEDDVTRAVLFGRLLIDWQLIDPMFREENEADALALGDGPWTGLMDLVYDSGDQDPVAGLGIGIEIMRSVQDEPWAGALYLRELYIPQFESIPSDITTEQLAAIQAVTDHNLRVDPGEFLTEVQTPMLAFFGEDDLNVDSEKSAALYEQYLSEAGNDDFTIVVIPDVGHGITTATPGYWDTLSEWVASRFIDRLTTDS